MPVRPADGSPATYDGIVTASQKFVLGVQGADCPSIILYDPSNAVVGAAHSGWKPTVRGVATKTVQAMCALGASPGNILAYVGPGVSDRFNEFTWGESMEPQVKEVFVRAGREDLLGNTEIRYKMTSLEREELQKVTGRPVVSGVSMMLSTIIAGDLKEMGLLEHNIEINTGSTICERRQYYRGDPLSSFCYHSCRRDNGKDPERPGFGSSSCVVFLR